MPELGEVIREALEYMPVDRMWNERRRAHALSALDQLERERKMLYDLAGQMEDERERLLGALTHLTERAPRPPTFMRPTKPYVAALSLADEVLGDVRDAKRSDTKAESGSYGSRSRQP